MNDDLDKALERAIGKVCSDSGAHHIKDAEELILHLVANQDVPEDVLRAIRELSWGSNSDEREGRKAA
jgi:hypothetical protein